MGLKRHFADIQYIMENAELTKETEAHLERKDEQE
jgi:hypothetical protein